MAGENLQSRLRSSRQPGGRPPAPGVLEPVQAFINTHYDLERDHGAELLCTPRALGDWLACCGLLTDPARLGDRDLQRALLAREGLRELARANTSSSGVPVPALRAGPESARAGPESARAGPESARAGPESARAGPEFARAALNEAVAGAIVALRFTPEGPCYLTPAEAGLDGALGALLAGAAQAMVDGSWTRLKICPGSDCGWAFYDHSRNQGGRWCSMSVCGGRAKARSHYRRRRDRED
jgi:predicted RNA-binding Zn ribbon-like protein